MNTRTLPRAVKKQGETVARRLEWMGKTYGVNRLLALCPSTVEPWEWGKLTRQWNNLWSKHLRHVYDDYLLVPEFGDENGRLHCHPVVVARGDVRTGFDFEARRAAKKRGRGARWKLGPITEALKVEIERWNCGKFDKVKREWSGTGVQLAYGFGYTRVEPVETLVGYARYLGGYLTKGFEFRGPKLKGKRLIRCSERVAKIKPPRQGLGFWLWDAKLAAFCTLNGLSGKEELRAMVGNRWAWDLKEVINDTPLDSYPDVSWMDVGDKLVTVFGWRVAWRSGELLTAEDRMLKAGSFKVTSRKAERRGHLNGWDYRFERRWHMDVAYDAENRPRRVPAGPYFTGLNNDLVLREDLGRIEERREIDARIRAQGLGIIWTQVTLGLDDDLSRLPSPAERRKMAGLGVANPF